MEIGATRRQLRGDGISAEQRIRDLMEEKKSRQVGPTVFGVGENNRTFAVSAPAVCSARRSEDEKVRLTSAVTVSAPTTRSRLPAVRDGRPPPRRPRRDHGRALFIDPFRSSDTTSTTTTGCSEEKLTQLLAIAHGPRSSGSSRCRCRIQLLWIASAGARSRRSARAGLDYRSRSRSSGTAERSFRLSTVPALGSRGGHDPAQLPVSSNSHAYSPTRREAGRSFPGVRGDDERDRPRARLGADPAAGLRRAPHPPRRPSSSGVRGGDRGDPLSARALGTTLPRADERRDDAHRNVMHAIDCRNGSCTGCPQSLA